MDISDIIAQVKDKSGLHAYVGDDERLVVNKIPFNIPQLDSIVGGGIPCSRISEIVGEYSVGKSFLCNKLIASAQSMGLDTVYLNVEHKLDPLWVAKNGVDLSKLVVIDGNVGEIVFDAIITLVGANVGLIVVDSIAAMVPLAEDEEEMSQNTIGLQARMLSKGFRKVLEPLSTSNTALVYVNQLRSGIGPYATDTYPGGRSQYFYSSLTIHVRRGEWIVESDIRKGFRIECKTVKNTLAPPFAECSIPFRFDGDVDIALTLCELALERGTLKKSGGWYTLHNEERMQGWDNLVAYYRENIDKLTELSKILSGVTINE